MFFDNRQLFLQFFEFIPRRQNHFRLCPCDEILVGKFGLDGLNKAENLLFLLFEAGSLGRRVDHIMHIHLNLIDDGRGGLMRLFGLGAA